MKSYRLFFVAVLAVSGCATGGHSRDSRKIAEISTSSSLYCALSNYGTPTETVEHSASPYSTVQVDLMSPGTIQVSITDNYNGTSDVVFTAKWTPPKEGDSVAHFNGLMLGTYQVAGGGGNNAERAVIELRGSKIVLVGTNVDHTSTTYGCEIPGRYESDYSKGVESGRLTGW